MTEPMKSRSRCGVVVPPYQEIEVDGWVGFKVVVPSGTSIYLVNNFLAAVMGWTNVEIRKLRPAVKPAPAKPAEEKQATSLPQKLFAFFCHTKTDATQ